MRMVGEDISGTETLHQAMPGARLVKAYSSFQPSALRRLAEKSPAEQLAVAIAADDPDAKATVTQLIRESGGQPFDLGGLQNARLMEIPDPFALSDELTLDAALQRRQEVLGY